MRFISWVCVAVIFVNCAGEAPRSDKLSIYFDLDSLLDSQVLLLESRDATYKKTVLMDEDTEEKVEDFDSSGWANEFRILRDFDLNKPYNIGAYKTTTVNGKTTYSLNDITLDAPVKSLIVEKVEDELLITGEYFEDKTLYQHSRQFSLSIKDGVLHSIQVSGFQKMVLKDTIVYRISGEVIQ